MRDLLLKSIVLSLVVLSLAGCPENDPPIADFAATPLNNDAPLAVVFSNTSDAGSKPFNALLWNFGDGDTSNAVNPVHTYAAPGLYTVSLTVTTSVDSSTETKTDYIQVNTPAQDMGIARAVPQGNIYSPGQEVKIELTLNYFGTDPVQALGIAETMPAGWTYVRLDGGEVPDVVNPDGVQGAPEFAYLDTPVFPFSFSYVAQAPQGASGSALLEGSALYRTTGDELESNNAQTTIPIQ